MKEQPHLTTSPTPPRRTTGSRAPLVVLGLSLLAGLPATSQDAGVLSGTRPTQDKAAAWAGDHPRKRHERTFKGAWEPDARERRTPAPKGAAPDPCEWSSSYGFGGLDGPVYAQATFDDGSGEALYVGGEFTTAGGLAVFGIAKWDGSAWSALGSGMDDVVWALATFDDGSGEALYAGGFFTTAGGVPAAGIARWDGTTWSDVGDGGDLAVYAFAVFDDGGGDALFVGGEFSTAGGAPADNVAKWDGAAWSALGDGVDDYVNALAVFDDGGGPDLYVGGIFEFAGGAPADFIARWDGAAWSTVGLGMDDEVAALKVFDDGGGDALFAGGFFEEADGISVFGVAQWDGADWSDLDTGMDGPVLALTTYDDGGGEALYAGGFFVSAGSVPVFSPGVARWDGVAWSALDLGVSFLFGFLGEVDSLAVFDDGGGADLYAGGIFIDASGTPALFHASWDGAAWSSVFAAGPDFQGTDAVVYAFEIFDDGSGPALYAGGEFLTAGGVPVHGIARWDGTSWSPLGSGVSCEDFFPFPELRTGADDVKGIVLPGCGFPSVQALAVYDEGSGPALYAGGIFDLAGGVPAANVARWDGTAWSALGDGTDDVVEALAVFDGELYAGGEFDFAGGVPASNVARWDGTDWAAVGAGTDDDVETLAVFDDGGGPDLYAGGEFDFAGGVPASMIARWDGSAWSAVGLGMDDEVETLYVYDDGGGPDLYAGGAFDVAGGASATSIARWDGSAWSAVGGGMSTFDEFRTVDALMGFDDGGGTDLYAGGFFEFAGGVPAANVARWDGAAWSPLGAGTDEEVEALAAFNAPGPSLFAGGFFTEAGGLPSSFIGEWTCTPAELTIDDVTLAEGDAGTTDFVFTISRSHNATDASVDVATADGAALSPGDYAALPLQTVSFAAGGPLTATVTVSVVADTVEEAAMKDFFVNLSSPAQAIVADGQGVGTILDDDDDGAPAVAAVDSTAATGGALAECEEARVAISRLHVTFDQPMGDPAGDAAADDVTNPANYRLFAAGPDHDVTSAACAAPAGDDVTVVVVAVSYDSGSMTTTLELGTALADAPYRLVVCDEIVDLAGNPLAGGDFTRTFRVERENLFVNGQLDCDLGGWTPASTPGEIAWAGDDVDAASISGSAAITNLTSSTDFSLGQCVPVAAGVAYELSGTVRLAAPPGVDVFLSRTCRPYAAAGCAGSPLVTSVDLFPVSDTGGAWESVASTFTAPPGTASAFCGFELTTPGGEAFTAALDDLRLAEGDAIFTDGFESGDTTAWTLAVP